MNQILCGCGGEPYENGGERAMEERETCSGWERVSREKNIPIFGIRDGNGILYIRIINEIFIKISALMSTFFWPLDLLKSNSLVKV